MMRRGVLFLALGVSLGGVWAGAAELDPSEPMVAIQFYFSKKDKDLPACDKVLADAVKLMPQILIERVVIDDKVGYAKLAEVEKALKITKPGDRTLVFGPYFLLSKGDQKDIETYFVPMMKRLINQMKGNKDFKDRLPSDVSGYAKSVFGKSAVAVMEPESKANAIIYYRVNKGGEFQGWIADAYDPISCPVCSSAQFVLAADAKGTILNIRPVRPIERLSTHIPEEEIEEYCNQFKGKSPTKALGKLDGVSRATKSTRAYMEAINQILVDLPLKIKAEAPKK